MHLIANVSGPSIYSGDLVLLPSFESSPFKRFLVGIFGMDWNWEICKVAAIFSRAILALLFSKVSAVEWQGKRCLR